MRRQVANWLARAHRPLDSSVLAEAVNGFGMNRHRMPGFVAETADRLRSAGRWGFGGGVVLGAVAVAALTLIVVAILFVAGVM